MTDFFVNTVIIIMWFSGPIGWIIAFIGLFWLGCRLGDFLQWLGEDKVR